MLPSNYHPLMTLLLWSNFLYPLSFWNKDRLTDQIVPRLLINIMSIVFRMPFWQQYKVNLICFDSAFFTCSHGRDNQASHLDRWSCYGCIFDMQDYLLMDLRGSFVSISGNIPCILSNPCRDKLWCDLSSWYVTFGITLDTKCEAESVSTLIRVLTIKQLVVNFSLC